MSTQRSLPKSFDSYVSHSEFERHVQNVASGFNSVDRQFIDLKKSLDNLSNKLDTAKTTSWPLVISGLGLLLSLIASLFVLVWWGMSARFDGLQKTVDMHIATEGHPTMLRFAGLAEERIEANAVKIDKLDEVIHRELETLSDKLSKESKLLDEHSSKVFDKTIEVINNRLSGLEKLSLEGGRWSKEDHIREFEPIKAQILELVKEIATLKAEKENSIEIR